MLSPFTLSQDSDKLTALYLDAVLLKDFFVKAKGSERLGIIRLWITEGIPYAFRDNPLLYEAARTFIARQVNVHTKEVTIVGSGRIGYSLKKKEWGRKFTPLYSDLDFTIISNDLYKNLVNDFQKWVGDIHTRKTRPENISQMDGWLKAIKTVNNNIPKGYINTKQLYSNKEGNYPTVKKCNSTMWMLNKILAQTASAPQISGVSIRVYSDWRACVRQLQNNFEDALIW